MNPHHLDADPDSTYHPDVDPVADTDSYFYLGFFIDADADPDADPTFRPDATFH
jgi:hypothetical protein